MKKKLEFPKGFYWGAATSSYQVEGGIDNCDWAEAAREGRVPFAGKAADHYRRYEEDFDIAKFLGHNCQRISIEWARIEPEEGKFNEKEIEHYRKVLLALKKHGMEPFITIWHFTLPIWFVEKGGFGNINSPKYFSRYCIYLLEKLGDLCTHWSTMNEPMVYSTMGWMNGAWPPFKRSLFKTFIVVENLVRCHKLAYKKMKKISPSCEIGFVKNNMYYYASWNPFSRFLSSFLGWIWNHYFIKKLMGQYDIIGLNYYLHQNFGLRSVHIKSDIGWEIDPKGIYHMLKELSGYGKPVYVAEAGIADREDNFRAQYIESLVYWMHRAIEEKIPLKGFMYWSLLDNFEWAHGFAQEFGLVEIEPSTLKRTIRKSAYRYKKICQNNALEI